MTHEGEGLDVQLSRLNDGVVMHEAPSTGQFSGRPRVLTFTEARDRYRHAPGDRDVHAALFVEIGRLRAILRVNLLRHVPGVTHAEIDALLDGSLQELGQP